MSHPQQNLQIIQPDNPLSVLDLISADKVELFARLVTDLVREGHAEPLKVHVQLKAWEKAAKLITDAIKPEVEREAAKYGENQPFNYLGAEVVYTAIKTDYDYSKDVTWANLRQAVEQAVAKQKEREAILKAIKTPITEVDPNSGETFEVAPAQKKTAMGVKITIK